MLLFLSLAASVIAALGCVCLMIAAMMVRRFTREREPDPRGSFAPAVTILKPLHGAEAGLLENLRSFCVQDYAGHVQIVFGVQDANDDAIAVVERLRAMPTAAALDLVVAGATRGTNLKVCNLLNMAPRIRNELVVIADSDMRVRPDYLRRIAAALEHSGSDAVTCLYFGEAMTGIWARLSALSINAHFLPGVVAGTRLGLAHPCFGSTLAMRREALAAIGGFLPFVDCLADDYAMGDALRAHGFEVAIPRFAIAHICVEPSACELLEHEVRWARTIRIIDPVGHAGSIISHPLPWALIALVLGSFTSTATPMAPIATSIAIAAIACRVILLRQVRQSFGIPPQSYWLLPARDLLSFAVFVFSFLGRDVRWKGRRYQILRRQGRLAHRG
jgi:ceramide glucosyltransferase